MVAVSATLAEINADLAVLLKNFQQHLEAEVTRQFSVALTTGLQEATSTSTVNRTRIFRTKEVILLPGVAENEVVRGSKKSDLMRQGFIRGELERNKRWSDAEIYTDLYII